MHMYICAYIYIEREREIRICTYVYVRRQPGSLGRRSDGGAPIRGRSSEVNPYEIIPVIYSEFILLYFLIQYCVLNALPRPCAAPRDVA